MTSEMFIQITKDTKIRRFMIRKVCSRQKSKGVTLLNFLVDPWKRQKKSQYWVTQKAFGSDQACELWVLLAIPAEAKIAR